MQDVILHSLATTRPRHKRHTHVDTLAKQVFKKWTQNEEIFFFDFHRASDWSIFSPLILCLPLAYMLTDTNVSCRISRFQSTLALNVLVDKPLIHGCPTTRVT